MIYVGLQGSYKSFEIALFQDKICLQTVSGDGVQASSQFLVFFQKLLQKNKKKLSDLQFIAVDQGPGAFTSLRVIIATVNALAFETGVSLVGVDGLDALAQETCDLVKKAIREPNKVVLVSLLNAYNNEVYYSICDNKGYKKIDCLIDELEHMKASRFLFTGNGASLHKELIFEILGDRIVNPYVPLSFCSAKQVGIMGFLFWEEKKNIYSELKPLYLKTQTFAVR
ncbi:tRNA (adenosine(37)-N6)-threonylcarbamoyltransferase complex dimerization subunit type 1 TsaB [Candidatus Dependentiae bacterium]|nr:tRNA (adenosine(37)-N6)-threonylcarbamoyltransferase complex dimerization subunit type 1 TsaB [Candidatus Dependentiae bacterium]